jgi:hypothetical protein
VFAEEQGYPKVEEDWGSGYEDWLEMEQERACSPTQDGGPLDRREEAGSIVRRQGREALAEDEFGV